MAPKGQGRKAIISQAKGQSFLNAGFIIGIVEVKSIYFGFGLFDLFLKTPE